MGFNYAVHFLGMTLDKIQFKILFASEIKFLNCSGNIIPMFLVLVLPRVAQVVCFVNLFKSRFCVYFRSLSSSDKASYQSYVKQTFKTQSCFQVDKLVLFKKKTLLHFIGS